MIGTEAVKFNKEKDDPTNEIHLPVLAMIQYLSAFHNLLPFFVCYAHLTVTGYGMREVTQLSIVAFI